jgi:hypothetical protein
MKLSCREYSIDRSCERRGVAIIRATFILTEQDLDKMPDQLANIERFMQTNIEFVKAQDRPRCFYCGSLNEIKSLKCESCGASM